MSLPAPAPGQRAVVTGASSGIGRALAHGLARRGHSLMIVARRAAALQELAAELGSRYGVEVEVRPCDLADRLERSRLRDELAARSVSVLCNNAGFPTCGRMVDNDPALEQEELEVNVVALHELTLAVLPGMLARSAGAILITGSTAGRQPVPTAATYSATKAFANVFAEALHVELKATGVACTLLAPGPVRTGFYRVGGIDGAESQRWFAWLSPERVAEEALAGLESGRSVVTPGPVARIQAVAGKHVPNALLFPVLRAFILPFLRSGGERPA